MFALSPFAFPSISVPTAEGDMELIFSTTLTSATNSVTTGTLATGFKSYLINVRGRSDRDNNRNAFSRIFFNNDKTDSNYQELRFFGKNDPSITASSQDLSGFFALPSAAGDSDFFGGATMHVYSPESTTGYKSFNITQGAHNAANNATSSGRQMYVVSGVWRNTSAITSLTFEVASSMADGSDADFIIGSSFEVYGLK